MSSNQVFVLLIIMIVSFAGVMKARLRARHGIVEDSRGRAHFIAPPQEGESKAELLKELETLRERVKVLERIATDERQTRSIAAEIEALRDK